MVPSRDLRFCEGALRTVAENAAYRSLLANVLRLDDPTIAAEGWRPFAFFDGRGRCVAALEATLVSLALGGSTLAAAGIRSVAVAPDWRGRGLFRALMEAAVDWCDMHSAELILLYTGEPALYARFGFVPVEQHAFVGPTPPTRLVAPAKRLDISNSQDRSLVVRILEMRLPVSRQAALRVPASLVLANLAKDTPTIVLAEDPPALIVYEDDGDTIVLCDIATAVEPDLPRVLGALGRTYRRTKTLFPPDRLGWVGEPVTEDTGLMARGTLPEPMTRPFMFPPTAEF